MNEETPTVLIVEDEPHIRHFVLTTLKAQQLKVIETGTLREGLAAAEAQRPDLIILDLGLPDGDGLQYLARLRTWSLTPVIVLSARLEEADKVAALDAGADDYLTKPFGVGELTARVRAALRRSQLAPGANNAATFEFSDIVVDVVARRVLRNGADVHLTPIEYKLLRTLIINTGKVLTHRRLLKEVWGPNHSERTHYLRIYMGHLRQKLEADPARPRHIVTETGVGYRFMPD